MSNSVGTSVGDNLQSNLLNDEKGKELIPVFSPENQLYQHYFLWFLKHTDEKKQIWDWFSRELLPRLNTHDVLIDAGAGNGELMSHFLSQFRRCIAIEPNPVFTSELLRLIPPENLYQTTILDAPPSLPKANLVIESHVKYYIPPEAWEINTDCAISWLIPGGCLVEVLESEYSDFQRMRAEFLGQEYVRKLQGFAWQYSHQKGITVEVDTRDAWVICPSLEIMLGIAIFMMNDFPPEVLSNHPQRPTCEQLARWIHKNYYASDGVYRMSCPQDFIKYFLS